MPIYFERTAGDTGGGTTTFYSLRSDKDSHFTGAINVGNKEDESIAGLNSNKIRIKRVKVWADVNHGFNVIFWKSDEFDNSDLDLDTFCGVVNFIQSDGFQIGGSGKYYYDSGDLDILYEDKNSNNTLYCSVMITAINKSAGDSDEIVIEIEYEPVA